MKPSLLLHCSLPVFALAFGYSARANSITLPGNIDNLPTAISCYQAEPPSSPTSIGAQISEKTPSSGSEATKGGTSSGEAKGITGTGVDIGGSEAIKSDPSPTVSLKASGTSTLAVAASVPDDGSSLLLCVGAFAALVIGARRINSRA